MYPKTFKYSILLRIIQPWGDQRNMYVVKGCSLPTLTTSSVKTVHEH